MDDLISRQAAIDALDTAIEHYDGIAEECRKKADIERNDYMDMRDDAYEARQLAQWLNELKYLREKIEQLTIKPEPQWIPVSECVPYIDMSYPHSEHYLVQYDSGNMDVASWSNVNRFWTDHVTKPYWNCVQFAKVIAWMPLPKIYKPNK